MAEATYDTVAAVGTVDETNPLLIYQQAVGQQLIGATTVLYADNAGGNLTAVDLVSGRGWQITDGGAAGPGEFGGATPWFSETDGIIYTALPSRQGSMRNLDGKLLDTYQYGDFIYDQPGAVFTKGLLDRGIVISVFAEQPDWSLLEEEQVLRREVRAYAPDRGLLWSYTALPEFVVRVKRQSETAVHTESVRGPGVAVHGRHNTVVLAVNHEPWLTALNSDGTVRAKVDLGHEVFDVFVDAQERVWVQVWTKNERSTGSYIVLNSDLDVLDHVTERSIRDAYGDYLLTIDLDESDLLHMYLLRRRSAFSR